MKQFVNQPGFLPNGVALEDVPRPKVVLFRDGSGAQMPVQQLSDGFRSILSLALELIRHLVLSYGEDAVFAGTDPTQVQVPGVVLIDEVDVHLHPTWQRTVASWFVRAFPRMQFIVSTHSPLVCQGVDRCSVFVLPSTAGGPGRFLTDDEKSRLVFGNVLDALATGAFGVGVAQSDAGKQHLERLADLNATELEGSLTPDELVERERLRAILPSNASRLADGAK